MLKLIAFLVIALLLAVCWPLALVAAVLAVVGFGVFGAVKLAFWVAGAALEIALAIVAVVLVVVAAVIALPLIMLF